MQPRENSGFFKNSLFIGETLELARNRFWDQLPGLYQFHLAKFLELLDLASRQFPHTGTGVVAFQSELAKLHPGKQLDLEVLHTSFPKSGTRIEYGSVVGGLVAANMRNIGTHVKGWVNRPGESLIALADDAKFFNPGSDLERSRLREKLSTRIHLEYLDDSQINQPPVVLIARIGDPFVNPVNKRLRGWKMQQRTPFVVLREP